MPAAAALVRGLAVRLLAVRRLGVRLLGVRRRPPAALAALLLLPLLAPVVCGGLHLAAPHTPPRRLCFLLQRHVAAGHLAAGGMWERWGMGDHSR